MPAMDNNHIMFILAAFVFQLILIIHFALRRWHFGVAMRYGPLVYAFSIPAAILSIIFLRGGMNLTFWLAGFLYLAWALYGYTVEFVFHIEWHSSLRWPILVPYLILYLATVMFYWWPLAPIYKPLWYVYTILFGMSTYLNVTSHKSQTGYAPAEN